MASSVKEQEIVFIRYVERGEVEVKFVAVKGPRSPDAKGIFASILDALKTIGITDEVLNKKLVGFGCDGAAVMIGRNGGVATYLKQIQPRLLIVHCLAHRLELAVKKIPVYSSLLVLLVGIYYFYHYSPKQ